jgi:hypothetical protein
VQLLSVEPRALHDLMKAATADAESNVTFTSRGDARSVAALHGAGERVWRHDLPNVILALVERPLRRSSTSRRTVKKPRDT